MLVLSRKTDEKIFIGDDIVIQICRISADTVRIGIDAPKDVPINRDDAINTTFYKNQEEKERNANHSN